MNQQQPINNVPQPTCFEPLDKPPPLRASKLTSYADAHKELCRGALEELSRFRQNYGHLREFAAVAAEIDRLTDPVAPRLRPVLRIAQELINKHEFSARAAAARAAALYSGVTRDEVLAALRLREQAPVGG